MQRLNIETEPGPVAPWAGTSADRFETAVQDFLRPSANDVAGIVYFGYADAPNHSASTFVYRSASGVFSFGPHLPQHVDSLAREMLYDHGDATLPTTIVTVYDRDRDRFAHRRFNRNKAKAWNPTPSTIKHLAAEAWVW